MRERNKNHIEPKFDCELKEEMMCPYCGHEQSDSYESCPDDECGETHCEHCGKEFGITVQREVTYTTYCLKGEHAFVKDNWHIEDCMTCERCGETKFTRHGNPE